jgi:hypothetical protein
MAKKNKERKARIIGCVIFYNDTPALVERSLRSLRQYCDHVIAIDGAFKDFPHDNPASTDGSLEVANKYAEVIGAKAAWSSQMEKRNQYFIGGEGDYYLILDTDEYITGTLPKAHELTEPAYKIPINTNGLICGTLRLIRHVDGMEYRESHAWIWDKQGRIINHPDFTDQYAFINTAEIVHCPQDRPMTRQQEDGLYVSKRNERTVPSNVVVRQSGGGTVKMLFTGTHYHGFDGNQSVLVRNGDFAHVSVPKMEQLMRDFPNEWIIAEEK